MFLSLPLLLRSARKLIPQDLESISRNDPSLLSSYERERSMLSGKRETQLYSVEFSRTLTWRVIRTLGYAPQLPDQRLTHALLLRRSWRVAGNVETSVKVPCSRARVLMAVTGFDHPHRRC